MPLTIRAVDHLLDLFIYDLVDHGVLEIPKHMLNSLLDRAMPPLGHVAREQLADKLHSIHTVAHMVQLQLKTRVQLDELVIVHLH